MCAYLSLASSERRFRYMGLGVGGGREVVDDHVGEILDILSFSASGGGVQTNHKVTACGDGNRVGRIGFDKTCVKKGVKSCAFCRQQACTQYQIENHI